MTNAWNAAKGGLSSLGSGISHGLSSLGDWAGDLFTGSTGQPSSGSPDASSAILSQGAAEIPDVSGGASPGNLSVSGFTAPNGVNPSSGSDSLSRMLATMTDPKGAPMSDALATASAGGASTPAAATGGADGGGFNLREFLGRNAVPGALLGYTLYRGNQVPDEVSAMSDMARDAAGRAGTLQAGAMAAMNGQLPGGAQASIDQALAAAQARIRSNYAALGMTGSSPEAQDLAYAELAASAQAFQIGNQMATTGFNAAAGADNLSAHLYEAILNAETQRGTALGDALAEFAAGLVDPDTTIGGAG